MEKYGYLSDSFEFTRFEKPIAFTKTEEGLHLGVLFPSKTRVIVNLSKTAPYKVRAPALSARSPLPTDLAPPRRASSPAPLAAPAGALFEPEEIARLRATVLPLALCLPRALMKPQPPCPLLPAPTRPPPRPRPPCRRYRPAQ